tara:strand:+ start:369 stop:824 length:456 start_codon:yes stop_codon:yes gene_type:complete
MTAQITSLASYINELPSERKRVINELRKTILEHLPKGFEETLSYGMIGYVVPHKIYPEGYHCNPELPLPFINLASQKNYISLYHMGLYADQKLLNWFIAEYEKSGAGKLNMGKSCIRFKNTTDIPYPLIGKLCSKITAENWIKLYEKSRKR